MYAKRFLLGDIQSIKERIIRLKQEYQDLIYELETANLLKNYALVEFLRSEKRWTEIFIENWKNLLWKFQKDLENLVCT